MSGQTDTLKAKKKRSRNERLIGGLSFFSSRLFLYKVDCYQTRTKQKKLSDEAENHAASCSGTFPTATEKRNKREEEEEEEEKKIIDEREITE